MSSVDVFNQVGAGASALDLLTLRPGSIATPTNGITQAEIQRAIADPTADNINGVMRRLNGAQTYDMSRYLSKHYFQGGMINSDLAVALANKAVSPDMLTRGRTSSMLINALSTLGLGLPDTTSLSQMFPEIAGIVGAGLTPLDAENLTGLSGGMKRKFDALGALGSSSTGLDSKAVMAALGAGGSFSDIADKIKAAAGIKGELTPEIIAANKDKLIGAFTTATYERATRELNTVKSDGSFSNPFWVREVPKVTGG
jgi:hypothetical protein